MLLMSLGIVVVFVDVDRLAEEEGGGGDSSIYMLRSVLCVAPLLADMCPSTHGRDGQVEF